MIVIKSFKMRLSTILPLLVVYAKNRDLSDYGNNPYSTNTRQHEECLVEIPDLGGSFETINNGSRGQVKLLNYPFGANCKHVVQADSNCSKIKINYRDVAVENHDSSTCFEASFWFEANGSNVTPAQCHCFGDGCFENGLEYYDYFEYPYSWTPFGEFDVTHEVHLEGSDEILIDSNSFTFYFESDFYVNKGGHVVFDWECVEDPRTTSITNITEMSTAVLDGSGKEKFTATDGTDYGCAGRGTFDPFATTEGHIADTADRAFYVWKKCVQCATGNDPAKIEPYDYDQVNDSCGEFSFHCSFFSAKSRPFRESIIFGTCTKTSSEINGQLSTYHHFLSQLFRYKSWSL